MTRSITQMQSEDEHTEGGNHGVTKKRATSSNSERYRWSRIEAGSRGQVSRSDTEGGIASEVNQRIKQHG